MDGDAAGPSPSNTGTNSTSMQAAATARRQQHHVTMEDGEVGVPPSKVL